MSGHRARKRFGQHFLVDELLIGQILDALDPLPNERIVEIGPGQGALTAPLLARGVELTVLEIDRDLIRRLETRFAQHPRLTIIQGDALDIDLSAICGTAKVRVFGNLPYNITSPLLVTLLQQLRWVKDMAFMLQKEVVDRICASPGNSQYGRLTVLVQSQCSATSLLDVPPHAFSPPPKVISSFVRLWPHSKQPAAEQLDKLSEITRLAFSQRRKMVKKSLRSICSESLLKVCGIDPSARAQDIGVDAYLQLARELGAG